MFCCDELNFNIEYIDNFSMDYDALNNSDLAIYLWQVLNLTKIILK